MMALKIELLMSRKKSFNEDEFKAEFIAKLSSLGYDMKSYDCYADDGSLDKIICNVAVNDKSQAGLAANSIWHYRIIVENIHSLKKEYDHFDVFSANVCQLF